MIAHLDTSALIKLFVVEDGSDLVEDLRAQADAISASRIAFVEACAALSRRHREKRLTQWEYLTARRTLAEQWTDFAIADFDEIKAGELAARHKLRGLDAIHLQAALEVRDYTRHPSLTFCTFDERQAQAARAERLTVVPGMVHSHCGALD